MKRDKTLKVTRAMLERGNRARYVVVSSDGTSYEGDNLNQARAAFITQPTADLIIDGYRVARRVNGERIKIEAERVA